MILINFTHLEALDSFGARSSAEMGAKFRAHQRL